ncbi:MAG: hypothetical protein ACFFCW_18275 [Candidatus Hodarchaeota archaeon]
MDDVIGKLTSATRGPTTLICCVGYTSSIPSLENQPYEEKMRMQDGNLFGVGHKK